MTASLSELATDILQLPRSERWELVRILLESDTPASGDTEQAWHEEIRARIRAIDAGQPGIPYAELRKEIATRFGW